MPDSELLRTLRGRLLVAAPSLGDANFFRTVILMLEHHGGTLGLVLNRPSSIAIAEAAPDWSDLVGQPGMVFQGGPVERTSAIGLARYDPAADLDPGLITPLHGDIGIVDLARGPEGVAGRVRDIRIFSGYAGWSEGQLESEIEAGGWLVLDAAAFDSLTPDTAALWARGLYRAFANGPWGNAPVYCGGN